MLKPVLEHYQLVSLSGYSQRLLKPVAVERKTVAAPLRIDADYEVGPGVGVRAVKSVEQFLQPISIEPEVGCIAGLAYAPPHGQPTRLRGFVVA